MSNAESILVTGGAGFIGSHLAERLLRDGHSVTVIDDCSTGSLDNLSAVQRHPALRIIQSRVSDCADLPVLCAQSSFIFHLAAAIGVELAARSPVRVLETNLDETEALLLAASTSQTPVLFASSSEVYGTSTNSERFENDDLRVASPQSADGSYGCSKLIGEFLALAYHRERALPIIVARIFNTTGPRHITGYDLLIPQLITAALRNVPLRIHGPPQQTRSLCHVDDAVEALIRLKDNRAAIGQVINIGSPAEIRLKDVAEKVVLLTGSESALHFLPGDPSLDQKPARKPNLEKLRSITGFQPAATVDEIITSIARHFTTVTRSPSVISDG